MRIASHMRETNTYTQALKDVREARKSLDIEALPEAGAIRPLFDDTVVGRERALANMYLLRETLDGIMRRRSRASRTPIHHVDENGELKARLAPPSWLILAAGGYDHDFFSEFPEAFPQYPEACVIIFHNPRGGVRNVEEALRLLGRLIPKDGNGSVSEGLLHAMASAPWASTVPPTVKSLIFQFCAVNAVRTDRSAWQGLLTEVLPPPEEAYEDLDVAVGYLKSLCTPGWTTSDVINFGALYQELPSGGVFRGEWETMRIFYELYQVSALVLVTIKYSYPEMEVPGNLRERFERMRDEFWAMADRHGIVAAQRKKADRAEAVYRLWSTWYGRMVNEE